jgi:exonuclease III
MRIVCWNMNHWQRKPAQRKAAWRFLEELRPDVALLQETVPDEAIDPARVVYRKSGIDKFCPWGSALVSYSAPVEPLTEIQSRYSKTAADLHGTFPGSLAIARIEDLTLISFYGVISNGYSLTVVHRQLSDLTPLFDSRFGKRVVLGGDLNISTQLGRPHNRRHRNVLDRFASLGLVDCLALQRPPRPPLEDCPCEDSDCRHVQTHRHNRSQKPWQADYFFVSESLQKKVKSCVALNSGDPNPWRFSDHCPLILELDV